MEFIKKKRTLDDQQQSKPDTRIRINVGGTVFETWRSTCESIPGTRLALMAVLGESDDSWDHERREFFFDRHPAVFSLVLQYYRSEQLHTDQNLCGNIIQGELDFWGLTELDIEPCCWGSYSKFKEHRETLAALDDNFTQQTDVEAWNEKMTNYQRFKHKVWHFIEEPTTSRGAKIYAVVSMFFVVLSIAIFCLETYKWFRVPIDGAQPQNSSNSIEAYYSATGDQCVRKKYQDGQYAFSDTEPHPAMTYMDYVCAAYFTIEFILRVFFTPNKLTFIKSPLNLIDLLCLVPHLIAIIIVTADPDGSSKDTSNLFRAFLALRTVRILRIFKLMKHYSAFKILVYTIKVSTKELLLLVVFLFTGVLIFASIIFYMENDTFDSIPVGFWWALVTMTTVGYGDKVPKTEWGYIIGCFCVLCGVLTVAFTVPIVVNNFTLYYSHAQSRIKLPVHKRKELKRKIFLKNQKSLEFLQKLKWKRDRNKPFNQLETIQSPRSETTDQTSDLGTESQNRSGHTTTTSIVGTTTRIEDSTYSINSHMTDVEGSTKTVSTNDKTPPLTPDHDHQVHTVSASIDFSIADTISINLPNTPYETNHSNTSRTPHPTHASFHPSEIEQHKAESEQLLIDVAESDRKVKEERKRQLSLLNQKRELRRLQKELPKKRPSFGAGAANNGE